MSALNSDIERFARHFEQLIDAVRTIDATIYARQFRKNLLVSIIDTLARCAYPKEGNRARFTSFVAEFCDWKVQNRVSLPHLERLLMKVQDPEFSPLREYVRSQLSSWSIGSLIPLSRDPEISEIQELWPVAPDREKLLGSVSVSSLSHLNLLYLYRNSLVHEFRQPGHSMELADDVAPHYMSQSAPVDGVSPAKWPSVWLLHYPEPFFRYLAMAGIFYLREHLLAQGINPYDSFVFGDYWVESLNR